MPVNNLTMPSPRLDVNDIFGLFFQAATMPAQVLNYTAHLGNETKTEDIYSGILEKVGDSFDDMDMKAMVDKENERKDKDEHRKQVNSDLDAAHKVIGKKGESTENVTKANEIVGLILDDIKSRYTK